MCEARHQESVCFFDLFSYISIFAVNWSVQRPWPQDWPRELNITEWPETGLLVLHTCECMGCTCMLQECSQGKHEPMSLITHERPWTGLVWRAQVYTDERERRSLHGLYFLFGCTVQTMNSAIVTKRIYLPESADDTA